MNTVHKSDTHQLDQLYQQKESHELNLLWLIQSTDAENWNWGANEHQEHCTGSLTTLPACHKMVRSEEDLSDGQSCASMAKQQETKGMLAKGQSQASHNKMVNTESVDKRME